MAAQQPNTVRCPRCRRKQPSRGPDALYRCDRCGGMFDDDPDEGCPTVYNDPVRSAIAREERETRSQ